MNQFCFVLRYTGDLAQVESLVKSGANVNRKKKKSGLAPLHYAAGAGELRQLCFKKYFANIHWNIMYFTLLLRS